MDLLLFGTRLKPLKIKKKKKKQIEKLEVIPSSLIVSRTYVGPLFFRVVASKKVFSGYLIPYF